MKGSASIMGRAQCLIPAVAVLLTGKETDVTQVKAMRAHMLTEKSSTCS